MASYTDLINQATQIKNLVYKIQDTLTSPTIVNFFKQHPEGTQQILTSTNEYRTQRLVLYGLAEQLHSTVLPTRSQLLDRPQTWLFPGDVIVGWAGALVDKPRVIVAQTDNGYTWRYMDEAEAVTRNPVRYDRWFGHIGWEMVGSAGATIDDIYAIQDEEINGDRGLAYQLSYFSGREFLSVTP